MKKRKPQKTQEQRSEEVENIMKQFMDFGLPLDHTGVQEFISISKDFVNDGIGSSGLIKLTGFKRVLEYKYSNSPHITSSVVLKHAEHI